MAAWEFNLGVTVVSVCQLTLAVIRPGMPKVFFADVRKLNLKTPDLVIDLIVVSDLPATDKAPVLLVPKAEPRSAHPAPA
jgi:hypothetical protein